MHLHKKSIDVFVFLMCLYLIVIFKSFIFLIPLIFMGRREVRRNYIYLLLCFILFIFISYNNLFVAFQFLTIFLFYFLTISYFSDYKDEIYKINSYMFVFFIIFLILFTKPFNDYSLYNIFTFKERFWFVWGDKVFNPNGIGIMAALALIYFVRGKKYLFIIFAVYLLLITQSRGALLFVVVYYLISNSNNIKKMLVSLVSIVFLYLLILYGESFSRLGDLSANGREDRKYYAEQLILDNFPFGYDDNQMNYFVNYIGTTDNLYYHLVLKYGVFGIIFLGIIIFPMLIKKISIESFALVLAFLVYGFVEDSMIASMLFLCFFGINVFQRENSSLNNGVIK